MDWGDLVRTWPGAAQRCSRDVLAADCIPLCPALYYSTYKPLLHGLITDQLVPSFLATALQPDYTSKHDWPILIATLGHHHHRAATYPYHIYVLSLDIVPENRMK